MSYDLWFYFRARPKDVPQPSGNSGVVVDGPDEVDRADIPEGYRSLLAGRKYYLTVMASGTARTTFDELNRIRAELLRAHPDLVVLDHQNGTATVGGKQVALPRSSDPPTYTTISLCFEDGASFENVKFGAFIDLIERFLPGALPRRYGPLSGPMSTLAKTGLSAFKNEWRKKPDLVWYAKAPFQFVQTNIRNDARMFPNGLPPNRFRTDYRCSRIEIVGQAKICKNPGSCARRLVSS